MLHCNLAAVETHFGERVSADKRAPDQNRAIRDSAKAPTSLPFIASLRGEQRRHSGSKNRTVTCKK